METSPPQRDDGADIDPLQDEDMDRWQLVSYKRRLKRKGSKKGSKGPGDPREEASNKIAPTAAAGGAETRASGVPRFTLKPHLAGAQRQIRPRPPPLPKDDIKIIYRPKGGLKISEIRVDQATQALVAASGGTIKEEDFIMRLRPGSNIMIASTPDLDIGDVLRKIEKLTINDQTYATNTYPALPDDLKRAVIHGVMPGQSPALLKSRLRLRSQGVKILEARMLGKSETALITFDGPYIPQWVIYRSGEFKTYPYRPTRQICYVCGEQGHRSDVCPTPNTKLCRTCGTHDPPEGHPCKAKCMVCEGDHVTTECRRRLKTTEELRGSTTGGRQSRKQQWQQQQQQHQLPQQQQPQQQQQNPHLSRERRPRWLSSERDHGRSSSRGRSTVRDHSQSRSRDDSFPPLNRSTAKPKQQQQQPPQKQQKKGGVKVSWGAGSPNPLIPHSDQDNITRNSKEIKALREENAHLRKKSMTSLKRCRLREQGTYRGPRLRRPKCNDLQPP